MADSDMKNDATRGAEVSDEVLLAAPPRVPRHPEYFTADAEWGEPGIYPSGPPMEPASGPAPHEAAVTDELERRFADHPAARDVFATFRDVDIAQRIPEANVRAGFAALSATIGAPLVAWFGGPGAADHIASLGIGRPAGASRIAGPVLAGSPHRVINERYASEHFLLYPGPLVHEVLHHDPVVSNAEEVVLHAVLAMIHAQNLRTWPDLAALGTELSRRLNSFAITWLNSRHPGAAAVSLIAPDGPGTIPGGAPDLQTPDFWSVPFVGGAPTVVNAPRALGPVLRGALVDDAVLPDPLAYGADLANAMDTQLDDRWLSDADRVRVMRSLGLL